MNIFFSILIATILFSQNSLATDVAPVSLICQAKNQFLKRAYAERVGIDEVLIRAAGHEVVVIGESHAERSEKFYSYALKLLEARDSKLDCLMVEQPKQVWQPALDACNQRGGTCDREAVPDFSGVQAALDLGLKVFAVDAAVSVNDLDFAAEVPMRNRVMVANLKQLVKSKVCNHTVLIIGSMHGHRNGQTKSVLNLIREGVPRTLASIEIASPGLDSFGHFDQRWIWTNPQGAPICADNPGLLGENFGFSNEHAPSDLPLIYGAFTKAGTEQRVFLGSFQDFDSTLFLGCANPALKNCSPDFGDLPSTPATLLKVRTGYLTHSAQ